jgi:hypothetical protein
VSRAYAKTRRVDTIKKLFLAALPAGVSTHANAMAYSIDKITDTYIFIKAEGLIEQEELFRFAEFYQQFRTDKRGKILVLSSDGGSFDGAVALGAFIGEHNFGTMVTSGACVSACILVWSASASKAATPGSIGVHRAIATRAVAGVNEEKEINDAADKLGAGGAPPSVVKAAKTTPASGMYWLSYNELKA